MKAEQQNIKRLLNTAKGQIDGLNKMIDDDKYCIDISNQIMASQSILKKANGEVLKAHLEHCVKEAVTNHDATEKLLEIETIIAKLL